MAVGPLDADADQIFSGALRQISQTPRPISPDVASRIRRSNSGGRPLPEIAPTNGQRRPRVQRSVTAGDVIRRRLVWKGTVSEETSDAADRNEKKGKPSTRRQILDALTGYDSEPDELRQFTILKLTERLILDWCRKHKMGGHYESLWGLRSRILAEIQTLEQRVPDLDPTKEKAYLDRLAKKGFTYISSTGLDTAAWIGDAAAGTSTTATTKAADAAGKTSQAKALMNTYGLTLAEATAIATYSAQDYLYMNPAVAGDDNWLKGGIASKKYGPADKGVKGRKDAGTLSAEADAIKAEGRTHAGMAMRGLAKLPDQKVKTFRGRTLTPEFQNIRKGGTWVESAFASASRRKSVAEGFATDAGKQAGATGVLFELDLIHGRDISALSLADEGEVLVLPGATFRVTEIQKPNLKEKRPFVVIRARQVV